MTVLLRFLLCLLVLSAAAHADEYPSRPVRMVSPAAPGSALDLFARALADSLAKRWGQAVVVESKSGAGGSIAAQAVTQSRADGYTLFITTDAVLVANRFAFSKLPYDPDRSFSPISLLVQSDQLIVANASVPVTNFRELIAYSKSNPKALAYGRWSLGSSPHLLFETMNKVAGTTILGVPYRGVGPVTQAMMGNEVQLTAMSSATASTAMKTGKINALAIAAPRRSPVYPNVPTTAELGYPQLRASIWFALLAPAGLPQPITDKVERDVRVVLQSPAFFAANESLRAWTVVASSPAGLLEIVAQEVPTMGEMMKAAEVKPE